MGKKYKEIFIIALFAALSILVFRDYFFKKTVPFPANLLVSFYQPWASYRWKDYPSGPPNKPIGFDNLRIFYPLRKLTIDQIKNFEWPLWNPYNFSGNTHLANYQTAIFHPLSFLFLLLPQIDAWSIIIILLPFFGSIFMYAFLREISFDRKVSVFGAIVFAFSGFMIVWWEEMFMSAYSSVFLPLILYGIEKLYKKITLLSFIVLVAGLSFSVLSGFFQMTFYIYLFSFAWLLYRYLKEKNNKAFIFITVAYVLALMISAIHLVPSAEAYQFSPRGTTDIKSVFDDYFMSLYHLSTFIAPDFFGNPGTYNYFGKGFFYEKVIFVGIPALIFALYELIGFKNINFREKFLKISFLITLSLGFALPTSWLLLYNLKLPIVSVILPSRITLLSTFCISVLAAFGIDRFFKEKDKKKILTIFIFLGICILLMWGYAFYYKFNYILSALANVPLKNLIIPSLIYILCAFIIFIYLRTKKYMMTAFVLIIVISFFSSAYFANKYLYFSDRKFIFPQAPVISKLKNVSGIDRFWGVGNGYIDKNFATYYKLFSPEGFDSYYIKRYGELLFAAQNNGKLSKQIPRTDATLSGVGNMNEIFKNTYRKKLISLLGIRYIIASVNQKDGLNNSFDFLPIWNDDKFIIYENKNVLSRILIAQEYVVIKDPQEILDNIFNNKIDLSKTVILEEDPKDTFKKGDVKGALKIISYKPNRIIIESKLDKKAILFISDNYFPGWKAYIDNKEAKIYRADYSFRSVVAPEGTHIISFNYEPKSFYIGIIITIIGLLLFLAICIKIKYKQI